MVRIIGIIFIMILIIVGIAFTALNAQMIELNYLIGSKQFPLAAILLICLIMGILLSICIMGVSLLKLKAKNKWLESKLRRAQEKLAEAQH